MDEVRRLGALQGAELNEAKIILANEATRLAHGDAAAQAAANAARGVFDGASAAEGLPTLALSRARLAAGVSLAELAVEAGLAASRSAARRLAAGGGLRLDGVTVNDADQPLAGEGNEWRLSAGRKQHVRIALGE
ncbi:Tyrosine--tRNA ligase [compost metagenome]